MSNARSRVKDKHIRLDQDKLTRAKKALGARTETETIEWALETVIAENDRNRAAWAAHERFLRRALEGEITIRDVYGKLDRAERR